MKSLSRVRLLATPWTAAHQAPPSMGFSRQEYKGDMLTKPSSRTVDLELSKQKGGFGADSNILILGTLSKPFSLCVCIYMFIRQNGFVNQLPRYLNPKVSLDTTITTMFSEFQSNEKHFLRLALGQMLAHIISLMQDDTICIVTQALCKHLLCC